MSLEDILNKIAKENNAVLLKVNKEDLEESISGLQQLFPIINNRVIIGNGNNRKQAAKDSEELKKHFDTAITSMMMLLANMEVEE
nr:toxin PIN [uncultured Anaerocolumna sp.]